MAEWQMFPLWEGRPENVKVFSKKERDELELTIAHQVSDLLSRHGVVLETEVDISACTLVDEPRTYQTIELRDIPLEDEGDLVIGQIPDLMDGFCTDPGALSVNKDDEDGISILSLTVWDPEIETDHRIHDQRRKAVSRIILQELYEALSIIGPQFDAESTGNQQPLSIADFPLPIIEPELQALEFELES